VTDSGVSHELVWVLVILGAIICGVSASTLWVAQVADTNRKS
jgi:hypothetical protein